MKFLAAIAAASAVRVQTKTRAAPSAEKMNQAMALLETGQEGDPFCEIMQRMIASIFIMSDVYGDQSESVSAGELEATFEWLSQDYEALYEEDPLAAALIWTLEPLTDFVNGPEVGGPAAVIGMIDGEMGNGDGEVTEDELMAALGGLCEDYYGGYYYGDYYYGGYYYGDYYYDYYDYYWYEPQCWADGEENEPFCESGDFLDEASCNANVECHWDV